MPNPLKEGVVGSQIVKYFEENHGTVAVDAKSVGGSGFEDYHAYDITFEDGSVSRWRLQFSPDTRFHILSAEQQEKGLADDDGALVTIQAKALITDGEVTGVRLTGVFALLGETIHDIAQEAIHATYGTYSHGRVAVFGDEEWVQMRETEPESITVRVHTY
jgi:hypothetical protein